MSIVANYIKDRTKNAQFVIISLRYAMNIVDINIHVIDLIFSNNMFELADRLVGIYKTHDATKSVTINPKMISAEAMREDREVENSTAVTFESDPVDVKQIGKTHGRKALADATNIKV